MPSLMWSAYRKLKYTQKCSKSWAKTSEPNFLPLHLAAPWWKLATSMNLPETFFNPKQAREKAITAAKKPREKGKGKKIPKSKSLNYDFCACLVQNVLNAILVARTVSFRVTNAFSTRLKLIWPRSSFKTTKMSKKKTNFGKKFQVSMY